MSVSVFLYEFDIIKGPILLGSITDHVFSESSMLILSQSAFPESAIPMNDKTLFFTFTLQNPFLYCFSLYIRTHDPNLPRFHQQNTFIICTDLPYYTPFHLFLMSSMNLFENDNKMDFKDILDLFGDFSKKWTKQLPAKRVDLPMFVSSLPVAEPQKTLDFFEEIPLYLINDSFLDIDLCSSLEIHQLMKNGRTADILRLWEIAILNENLIVFGSNGNYTSNAVLAISSLSFPIKNNNNKSNNINNFNNIDNSKNTNNSNNNNESNNINNSNNNNNTNNLNDSNTDSNNNNLNNVNLNKTKTKKNIKEKLILPYVSLTDPRIKLLQSFEGVSSAIVGASNPMIVDLLSNGFVNIFNVGFSSSTLNSSNYESGFRNINARRWDFISSIENVTSKTIRKYLYDNTLNIVNVIRKAFFDLCEMNPYEAAFGNFDVDVITGFLYESEVDMVSEYEEFAEKLLKTSFVKSICRRLCRENRMEKILNQYPVCQVCQNMNEAEKIELFDKIGKFKTIVMEVDSILQIVDKHLMAVKLSISPDLINADLSLK